MHDRDTAVGQGCTRARVGETENRDQVGLLRSNMLPLSFSLANPRFVAEDTLRLDTRVTNTSEILYRLMPVIWKSNEWLPDVSAFTVVKCLPLDITSIGERASGLGLLLIQIFLLSVFIFLFFASIFLVLLS